MNILSWMFAALLGFMSLEILWRRWVWDQVPTQVAPWVVYSVLLVNSAVVWMLVQSARAKAQPTKNQKS